MSVSADIVRKMVALRRALHHQPELSNCEFASTRLIEQELRAEGVGAIRPIGPTGLVADITGARIGPIVGLRADIDALPMTEEATVAFSSSVEGVMHACGHDVHAAMAFGAAVTAHRSRAAMAGTLRVIFQPAEEAEPLGARAVVAAGYLAGVSAAVALHVDPETQTGKVTLRAGSMMASSDTIRITIRGRSSHAGWPQYGRDAITAAATVVQGIQALVTRRIDPRASVTINLGVIRGGTANNIVASDVVIDGVVRSLDESVRGPILAHLEEFVAQACGACGAEGALEVTRGEPALINDSRVVARVRECAQRLFGESSVVDLARPTMNGEDFAFYGEHVPVAMAWLGVRNEAAGITYPLHHPRFAVDEAAIPLGADLLFATGTSLLERPITSDDQ